MARFSFLLLATALIAQSSRAAVMPRQCAQQRFIANPQPPQSGCPSESDMWECDNKYCGGELSDKPGWCSYALRRDCDGYMSVDKHDKKTFAKPGDRFYGFERCPCKSKKSPDGGTDDGGSGIVFPFPPAPPGFLIPAPGVPNPKGDDTCPADYTDTKCKDCKAQSGWCTEGPQMGCPCLDECPTGDDLPSCSDEDCEGEDDGKCTIGYHKDCECKSECPNEDDTLISCSDDICKANDDDEKCTASKYKDCNCVYAGTLVAMFGNSDDIDTKNNYLKAAQEIIDNSDPAPEIGDRPDCAPQDSNHTTIDRSDMIGAIRGYCNGDLKRTEDDHKGPYLSNDDKGFPKYSIGFDFSDAQGGCKSADTYDPTFDDCLDKFTSIVDDCNTDSQQKTGGTRTWSTDQGCIEYSIIAYSEDWTSS